MTTFETAADIASQAAVAERLGRYWNCAICSFGEFSHIDWYAVRGDKFLGLLELKIRSHTRTFYPTIFLSVRKWLYLTTASESLRAPAFFAVQFTDALCWVDVSRIDASINRVAGRPPRDGAANDREPIIDVPIERLHRVID